MYSKCEKAERAADILKSCNDLIRKYLLLANFIILCIYSVTQKSRGAIAQSVSRRLGLDSRSCHVDSYDKVALG